MKEEYLKPQVISGDRRDGIMPAALGAFASGVIAGAALRKALSGGVDLTKGACLVEGGATL